MTVGRFRLSEVMILSLTLFMSSLEVLMSLQNPTLCANTNGHQWRGTAKRREERRGKSVRLLATNDGRERQRESRHFEMENDGITFPSSEKFQVSPRQPRLGGLDSPSPQSVMNPFMLLFPELVWGPCQNRGRRAPDRTASGIDTSRTPPPTARLMALPCPATRAHSAHMVVLIKPRTRG